jgi:hypothetical protein
MCSLLTSEGVQPGLCGRAESGLNIRLKVLENRVLRRIFGLKRDETMGDLRKLHNEELYKLYSSPNY